MAKQRYVRTTFRTDNYVENLDPSEKLVFLYLLTNEATNLCGIYEISIKRIAFETWYDKDMIEKILDRFTKDEKVFYIKWFVCITNYIKHQSINPSIIDWIKREIAELPQFLTDILQGVDSEGSGSLTLLYFTLLNFTLPKWDKTTQKNDKDKFLDFVYLTKQEKEKLLEEYWEKNVNIYINKLNWYIWQIWEQQAKKKYISHNHTIRNWFNRDWIKKITPKLEKQNEEYIPQTEEEKKKSKEALLKFRQDFLSNKLI